MVKLIRNRKLFSMSNLVCSSSSKRVKIRGMDGYQGRVRTQIPELILNQLSEKGEGEWERERGVKKSSKTNRSLQSQSKSF